MSASTQARLSGIQAEIARANDHIGDLKSRIDAFNSQNPYAVVTERQPNTGDKVFRVKIVQPVPDALCCIIGDAVHNLRSAIDHLV